MSASASCFLMANAPDIPATPLPTIRYRMTYCTRCPLNTMPHRFPQGKDGDEQRTGNPLEFLGLKVFQIDKGREGALQ